MKAALRRLLVLTLIGFCAGCAWFGNTPIIGVSFPFEVKSGSDALNGQLTETLTTQRKQSREFSLYDDVAHAQHFDRGVIQKKLESLGYYAAKIASQTREGRIFHKVLPGPLYTIAEIRLDFPDHIQAPSPYVLPAQVGGPMRAETILETLEVLREQVLSQHCLYEVKLRYQAQVNHQTQQGFVTYHLADSPSVTFARPQIFGATSVKLEYLTKQLTFKKGDCFRRTEIEKSRLALLNTQLLARVETEVGPPDDQAVSVSFNLTERSHRTIKAGVGYNTDTEANLILGWEHRNLFGSGQKLVSLLNLSKVQQSLDSTLTLPHFWRDDHILEIEMDLLREQAPAYETTQGELSAIISRPLKRHWSASVGTGLEFSHVVELDSSARLDNTEDYGLLSFPLGLNYNNTDNILNPVSGVSLALKSRPYVNLYQTGIRFIEHSALFSTYFTAKTWRMRPTIALRLAAGTLSDASLDEIPADHRFYSGGGGSIRGYEYQSVSPWGEDAPIGGLSFSEMSLELRLRMGKSWGLVLFGDGGFAFADHTPKWFDEYLYSAGLGVRYYTSFAPIRLDVARPLDIRYNPTTGERIDSPFQLYISIGQAF